MSERPEIYAAISHAMADISAVAKGKRNQQQGFMYRGIDDVMNALYPVLARHRLFLTPEVLEHTREERQTQRGGNLIYSILKVRYTLYAADGSSVSAVVIGEGMDSADKASNKAMAVAMKYAMFQLFCIPTEDMAADDPDGYIPQSSVPAPTSMHKVVTARKRDSTTPAAAMATGTAMPDMADPPINRKRAMDDVIDLLGLDGAEDFAAKVAALRRGGAIVDKPGRDMTDEEFMQTLNAVARNFGDAS